MSDFPFLPVDPDFLRSRARPSELIQNFLLRQASEVSTRPTACNLDEAPIDPIMKAVERNDKNCLIQMLRKRKKDPLPLSADNQKWTALHLAASKPEYRECLELLFQYDNYSILVDKDNQTNLGETPLHIACKSGCEENVLILLQKGCDPEKKTCNGYSALHIAASNGYMKIVRYLLHYFVNMNIDLKDEKGCTPLHVSAMAGYSDITGILLANGASILSVDMEGNLPLHLACKCGTFETACLLLEHNAASINDKNVHGITPFMLAIKNFDMRGIKYLLENGARTDICDNLGRMSIHFAASLNCIESFSLLVQSTNVEYMEQCCALNIFKALNRKAACYPYKFNSYTCSTIQMGPDYLNVLLNSHWPKSILQMPSLRCGIFDGGTTVFSPLAFLFFHFVRKKTVTFDAFDQCLNLLLEHEITITDEFQRVLRTNWPNSSIKFIHPFSILITSMWPNDNREHYFNLLVAHKVTTDYCLQCYHNNEKAFVTFNDYKAYYGPVIYALEKGSIEVLKLFISNSVILEPDILCNYLIMAYIEKGYRSSNDREKVRTLYQYLINLKPVYYKWDQQYTYDQHNLQKYPFMPAAEKFSPEDLGIFYRTPYHYLQTLFSCGYEDRNSLPIVYRFKPFPYITATEEFASVTLQQLCRTTIRQQLRETTLEDNLHNFRRKILELPLPKSLKEYLLFIK